MFRSPVLPVLALSTMTALSALTVPPVQAQPTIDAFSRFFRPVVVPVTVDNFVRAATDIEIEKYLDIAGAVNTLAHVRTPTPVDMQPTIRMNRDTLYSMAVIDVSQGATLTVPDVGDRYLSAMIVNQDHYINAVFHGGGTFDLDPETFETPYVIAIFRILVDSADPEDVAEVNAIQDAIQLEAGSANPFLVPNYDHEGFEHILNTTLELARSIPDSFRTFGRREDVSPLRHFVGTAYGWGGLPENEAFYINVEPQLPVGEYVIDVPADVPSDAFWSVSLYNKGGFFEPNDQDAYVVNSVTGQAEADGSIKVHLGGCDDGRVNCLPIMDGWNYIVRLYQPQASILDGSWTFPQVQSLK